MPIGPYKNFADCVAAQKSKGKSEESAKKICGSIEKKAKEKNEMDRNKLYDKMDKIYDTIYKKDMEFSKVQKKYEIDRMTLQQQLLEVEIQLIELRLNDE